MSSSKQQVGRPVSGSKPRKHITKTRYDNPSLISNSVTALFRPLALNPANEQPAGRQSPTKIQYADSLTRAEHQFTQRKDGQQLVQRKESQLGLQGKNGINDMRGSGMAMGMGMERRFSSPVIGPDMGNKYNYLNYQAIKSKQSHGYNIISNYAFGQ